MKLVKTQTAAHNLYSSSQPYGYSAQQLLVKCSDTETVYFC